jgi:hypothetical protein
LALFIFITFIGDSVEKSEVDQQSLPHCELFRCAFFHLTSLPLEDFSNELLEG